MEGQLSPGVETEEQITARLEVLRRKLTARTDRTGQAQPNFRENVAELKAEIARLEGLAGG